MEFPFPKLVIPGVRPTLPIIQGGMAIRVSMSPLAGAVAREGGIGLIAASGLAHDELREEIRRAREIAGGNGAVGINIMVAAEDFKNIVHVAMGEKIDLIAVGAGFSRDIFDWGREHGIPICPIVSSAKLAVISQGLGASAIIVEGTEAGGHLGTMESTWKIIPEVLAAVKIPVIAAGGIFDGAEFVRMMRLGVSGIQMATRFAATDECSAAFPWKKKFLDAKGPEDVVVIKSPVGLPGRALLDTELTRKILVGRVPIKNCTHCLRKCSKDFCIILALINAQKGDVENGIVFSGANGWRVKEIVPVATVFKQLASEIRAALAAEGGPVAEKASQPS